jgi:hypothetical protein
MVLAAQLERLIGRQGKRRLVEPLRAGIDQPGRDQRLCPAAALGEAAFDQQLIEPPARALLGHVAGTGAGCFSARSKARVRKWKRQVSSEAEAASPSAKPHHSPTAP